MTVSVIIPTYNEAKYIVPCLVSLQGQALKPKEIIIIDDGSTDDTLKIVNSLKIENCKLKIVSQDHSGAGAARNLGAKQARGDILVFLDADMEFDPDFLNHLVAPIIAGKTKGTFSKDEYVKNWHNPWARAWSFCLGLKDNRLIPSHYPPTAPVFRAILKSAFDRAGGFDEGRGYDDDWSLSEKLGYQATVAPHTIYYHYNPDSFWEIFHQAKWRAIRKYKFGFWGQIITLLKTATPLFWRRWHNRYEFWGQVAFYNGLQLGIIKSWFSHQVGK